MTSCCFPSNSAPGRLACALILCAAVAGCASVPPVVTAPQPPAAERGTDGQEPALEENDTGDAGDRGGPGAAAGPSETAEVLDEADGPPTSGSATVSPAGPTRDGGPVAGGAILSAPPAAAPGGAPADASRRPQDNPSASPGGASASDAAGAPSASPPKTGQGTLVLALSAHPAAVRVGEAVTVEVRASSPARVVDAPLHLLYDATRLRFVESAEGDYLRRDGSGTVFLVNGRSQPGVVTIGLGRTDRSRGLSGAGTHCRVRFEVIAPGRSRVAVGLAMAWADDGSMLRVVTGSIEISVP